MPLEPDALTTVAYAARQIRDPAVDSETVEDLINAFSRSIRLYAKRQFKPKEDDATKKFVYDGSGLLVLAQAGEVPVELRNVDSLVIHSDLPAAERLTLSAGGADDEADWRLYPLNKTAEGTYLWVVLPLATVKRVSSSATPISRRKGIEVSITGDWGAGVVPADVELACAREVANAYRNPEGFSSRSLGEFSVGEFTAETGLLPPLALGTRRLLERYRWLPPFA